MKFRWIIAVAWAGVSLCLAAYALLKRTTTAADLGYVPGFFAKWLDRNYDLRTFLMTVLIAIVPCLLLATAELATRRRALLAVMTLALLAMEFAQLWIPTRGFGFPDLFYTLAGAGFVEFLAVFWQFIFGRGAVSGRKGTASNGA